MLDVLLQLKKETKQGHYGIIKGKKWDNIHHFQISEEIQKRLDKCLLYMSVIW